MKELMSNFIVKSIGFCINCLGYIAPKKSATVAYRLFSEPRKGKINSKKIPKTLQNIPQEWFDYNNQKFVIYKWQGSNDIILLVHGWESNAARWKKMLPYLKKTGKTIIAIDGPAQGLSTGKEFTAIMFAQCLKIVIDKYNPSTVIGHSLGGYTLAYYQQKYSHQIKKMVLLGAPSDFRIILNNYKYLLGLNNNVYTYLENYIQTRFSISIDDFSAKKFLQNCTIQGIIAHDLNDDIVLFSEAKKLESSWKTARFIATKTFGHSLHDKQLYENIITFLEKE